MRIGEGIGGERGTHRLGEERDGRRHDPGALSFMDETPETAVIKGHMPTAANCKLRTDAILELGPSDYLNPSNRGDVMAASKTLSRDEGDRVIPSVRSRLRERQDVAPLLAAKALPRSYRDAR